MKVGDKLIAINTYNTLLTEGDIVEITGMDYGNYITFYNRHNGQGSHWNWGAVGQYFRLLQKSSPPKNDIEWLDRVKENFKNG